MPLVVRALRLAMLFLNVYESFKIMKTPPPSARNGGRPSVRALSQRKRDMKGCLAVWIVWCSFTLYERLAEGIVSIFIPFYDEIKCLGLLFLIMTRARGAEPIYLHVIRPLIKPYTSTLDASLDLFCMFGDMAFLVLFTPFRVARTWWQEKFPSGDESLDSEIEGSAGRSNGGDRLYHFNTPPHSRRNGSAEQLGTSIQRSSMYNSGATLRARPQQSDQRSIRGSTLSNTSSSRPQHQIWHPSPSAAGNSDDDHPHMTSTIDGLPNPEPPVTAEERARLEEWRQYPAFPSAYPPTPMVTIPRLPPVQSPHPTSCPPIMEDVQQDFHSSLLPPREPLNPGFVGSSSDSRSIVGVPNTIQTDESDSTMDSTMDDDNDEDDDDYEDEDDFDVTLRTPLPPFGSLRVQPRTDDTSSTASSVHSRSTALTTIHNGSLRTHSSDLEQSPTSPMSPWAAPVSPPPSRDPVLGKKRSFPQTPPTSARKQIPAREGVAPRSPPRPRPVRAARKQTVRRSTITSRAIRPHKFGLAEAGDEDADPKTSSADDIDSPSDRRAPGSKRRKSIPLRPAASTRTTRLRMARTTVPARTNEAANATVPSTRSLRSKPTVNTTTAATNMSRTNSNSSNSTPSSTRGSTQDA